MPFVKIFEFYAISLIFLQMAEMHGILRTLLLRLEFWKMENNTQQIFFLALRELQISRR